MTLPAVPGFAPFRSASAGVAGFGGVATGLSPRAMPTAVSVANAILLPAVLSIAPSVLRQVNCPAASNGQAVACAFGGGVQQRNFQNTPKRRMIVIDRLGTPP